MYKVAALYKFANIVDPVSLKVELDVLCEKNGITGALILAHEGINGTVAAMGENVMVLIERLSSDPLFRGAEIKYSTASEQPFYRMRISIKNEIVTMGCPNIDPNGEHQGIYVEPEEWNSIISDPDVLVLDTRNNYEVNIGTFENAVNPSTESFREFPKYVSDNLSGNKQKKIAMFCTGGIRCEKASIYLVQQGFDTVYNLKGGILKYLETVDEKESKWNGECFVFDQRVSVKHGLKEGTCTLCRGCRAPLTEEHLKSPKYEEWVCCPYCHDTMTEEKKAAARERDLQMKLAEKRKVTHLGYKHPPHQQMKEEKRKQDEVSLSSSSSSSVHVEESENEGKKQKTGAEK